MKASVAWLRELLSVATAKASNTADGLLGSSREIAERLTALGLEIEGTHELAAGLDSVVVAELVERRPHPKADRLTLVKVSDGAQTFDVVCGASNVPQVGGRVALAKVGTQLPGGMLIAPREVRGEPSAGMLCSFEELGLLESSDGILVVDDALLLSLRAAPERVQLGAPVLAALGLDDTILEVNVTPNRGDCLSHLGLAREVAAGFGLPWSEAALRPTLPPAERYEASGARADALVATQLAASGGCGRYVAWPLDGLTVGPSPLWLQLRLRAVGIRPISNVVDVTNYVLMERGQPLHAFDAAKLSADGNGLALTVRYARDGERLVTLDEVERTLNAHDLVIADGADRAVALAGVMGGASTAVDASTTRVVIESAQFDPGAVRRTARRLTLHSESSHRFERGIDIEATAYAAHRAAELLAEIAGARSATASGERYVDLYPAPQTARTVRVSRKRIVDAIAGNEHLLLVSAATLASKLTAIGLRVASAPGQQPDGDLLDVEIPSYRTDVSIEEDLVEEAARLIGYDQIPATLPPSPLPPALPPIMPSSTTVQGQQAAEVRRLASHARDVLVAQGLFEVITYGFTSAERIGGLDLGSEDPRRYPIELRNPLVEEQAVLRTSLVPGLLKTLRLNIDRGNDSIRLFELGSVFLSKHASLVSGETHVERQQLAVLLSGPRIDWMASAGAMDFFDIKGIAERLLAGLRVAHWTIGAPDAASAQRASSEASSAAAVDRTRPQLETYLHPHIATAVWAGDKRVGALGELHPAVLEHAGIELRDRPLLLELHLDELTVDDRPVRPRTPARFPSISRDLSLLVDVALAAGEVGQVFSHELLERAAIVEDYRDPNHVPAGKKALLWSLTYRAADRTLTDGEVGSVHDELLGRAVAAFGAQQR